MMCEYCENSKPKTNCKETNGKDIWEVKNNKITVERYWEGEDEYEENFCFHFLPINYCPICGRKLSDTELKEVD